MLEQSLSGGPGHRTVEYNIIEAKHGLGRKVVDRNREILCKCDGTLKAVGACLNSSIGMEVAAKGSDDVAATRCVMNSCARSGLVRISHRVEKSL